MTDKRSNSTGEDQPLAVQHRVFTLQRQVELHRSEHPWKPRCRRRTTSKKSGKARSRDANSNDVPDPDEACVKCGYRYFAVYSIFC